MDLEAGRLPALPSRFYGLAVWYPINVVIRGIVFQLSATETHRGLDLDVILTPEKWSCPSCMCQQCALSALPAAAARTAEPDCGAKLEDSDLMDARSLDYRAGFTAA